MTIKIKGVGNVMVINNPSSLKLMVNNIAIIVIAMFAAFWLSACGVSPSSTVQTQQNQTQKQTDIAISDEKIDAVAYQDCVYPPDEIVQACTTQSGEILKTGRAQCYRCVLSYVDAGTVCQDSSDCQGACVNGGEFTVSGIANQVGQCASDSNPSGCRQAIEKGVTQPAICVD